MLTTHNTDLVIIGGGPAGYQAGIRSGQLKIKTILVEGRQGMGGTCLNVGCIPSKHLLHVSQQYDDSVRSWKNIGLKCSSVTLDNKQLMVSKNKVIKTLGMGIDGLLKKNNVTRLKGLASFLPAEKGSDIRLQVTDGVKKEIISAKKVLITTGSEVIALPNITIDEETIISSTGALNLTKTPKTMLVIGAGVIGLELGSVWNRFGTKVTFVEALDGIMAGNDKATATLMQKILSKQGMTFNLNQLVKKVEKKKKGVEVTFESTLDSNKTETMLVDVVLVAIGRKPRTKELNLQAVGIEQDKRGFIKVDSKLQTSYENVFAAGDVIGGPMLAHKAGDEAIEVVNSFVNKNHKSSLNYSMIPSIVYTNPECASIGYSQEQLKEEGIQYKKGVFPFLANSRSRTTGHSDGQVTLLVAENGVILGAHIIGPEAGNLIHECLTAMEFGACVEDIALTCHGHPTYNEAIREAALTLLGGAIHI